MTSGSSRLAKVCAKRASDISHRSPRRSTTGACASPTLISSRSGGGNARPAVGSGLTNEEGNRLLRTVRRSAGSVVTWRRSQMILPAQGMDWIRSPRWPSPADRVREVIHNFNDDGFDSMLERMQVYMTAEPSLPVRFSPNEQAGRGRGVHVIGALAEAWGVEHLLQGLGSASGFR